MARAIANFTLGDAARLRLSDIEEELVFYAERRLLGEIPEHLWEGEMKRIAATSRMPTPRHPVHAEDRVLNAEDKVLSGANPVQNLSPL